MTKVRALLFVAGFFAATGLARADATGYWRGTLSIDKTDLHLLFKIYKTSDGRLLASMDSADQGARDIPVDKVAFNNGMLDLKLDFLKAAFHGALDPTDKKISGKWMQAGVAHPLVLNRGSANEPPPPEYLSASDLAANKAAAQKLAGTWTATLAAGKVSIQLTLNVMKNAQGGASATLDSPDQGLKAIPLKRFTYADGKLHFDAPGLSATYDGASFNNSAAIQGQLHQAGQVIPLNFKKIVAPKT
jgi:hypothetical protein